MNVLAPCISTVTRQELNLRKLFRAIFNTNLSVIFNYQPAYSWMEINILMFLPRDEIKLLNKKIYFFSNHNCSSLVVIREFISKYNVKLPFEGPVQLLILQAVVRSALWTWLLFVNKETFEHSSEYSVQIRLNATQLLLIKCSFTLYRSQVQTTVYRS
jgi:hypothetical protein